MTGHDFPADDGDPRLSPSIATILATQSPAHAWHAHSKLNPNLEPEDPAKFEFGNLVHSLLLKGEDIAVVGEWNEYRTDAAKVWRDEVRAEGRIPLKPKEADQVFAMVAAVREQLSEHRVDPPLFADGEAEVTLVWNELGDAVGCKGRLDWLRHDLATIDDVKTRSQRGGASASSWERGLYDYGAHIQAAAYLRAVETLTGQRPTWRWLVVETVPPYALNVVTPSADVIAMGEAEWERAVRLWLQCLVNDDWPAYGRDVVEVELPHWIESRFLERQAREELAA